MALIGYARVSTGEQTTDPQRLALAQAGCRIIHEEQASGGDRTRPVLARVLDGLGRGDVLVVVRLDRLARSLPHLLDVIERVEARGAHFRSLGDPVDTSSPQGRFTLQVLGAAAELERALIRERTLAGLRAARARGRSGGNPALKARDPDALARLSRSRDENYLRRLEASAVTWLPVVRRLRPAMPWADVARILNAQRPAEPWTPERLRRAARRYVAEGFLDPALLGRSPSPAPEDRLVAIVAAIAGSDPSASLRDIARRLEEMKEPTPRGRLRWHASSVAHLLNRARATRLLDERSDTR